MVEQRTVPFLAGMDLGLGIDDLTGHVTSLSAVTFTASDPAESDQGMEADYDTTLINTAEQMYEQLGVSVTAEGRYGLFSAEGKFDFMEKSKFSSTATFLVAHAAIRNAFIRAKDPVPVEDAKKLIENGQKEKFRQRYGDFFIRGIQSGGEYVAIISITSSDTETEQKLAASLKASFDGIVVGGSIDADVQHEQREMRRRSDVRVSTYQRGGSGEQISYTGTVDEVIARLKSLATSVQQNPKAYSVQAASYDTLVFPGEPSWFDIAVAQEVLEECLKNRVTLKTARNDVDAVMKNPEYFVNPPDRATLNAWSTELTESLNKLDSTVRTVIDSISDAQFVPFTLPDGFRIPQRVRHSSLEVEIFTHADYAPFWQDIPGHSVKLPLGSYDDAKRQLGIVGNDAISSLKVPEGLGVRGYEHAWFQGEHIDFTEDTPKVPMTWNDRISSLIVYRTQDGPPPPPRYAVGLDFLWHNPMILAPGEYTDLAATGLGTNTLGALLIPAGCRVQLWDEPSFAGETTTLTSDTLDLGLWKDRASSMKVQAG